MHFDQLRRFLSILFTAATPFLLSRYSATESLPSAIVFIGIEHAIDAHLHNDGNILIFFNRIGEFIYDRAVEIILDVGVERAVV